MSNTVFKITNPFDGFTRRLTFASAPSWAELASKLESLYDIRKDDICVSYADADGDEVVMSSDAELKEYYEEHRSAERVGEGDDSVRAIRFTVMSLSAVRGGEDEAPVPEAFAVPENPLDDAGADAARAPSANEEGVAAMENDAKSETGTIDSDDEEMEEMFFVLPFMGARGRDGRGRFGHRGHFRGFGGAGNGGRGHFGHRGHFRGFGGARPHHNAFHGHRHHHHRRGAHDGAHFPFAPPFMPPPAMPGSFAHAFNAPPPPPFGMFGRGRGGHHGRGGHSFGRAHGHGGRFAAHEHARGRRGMRGHPYYHQRHHDHDHPRHHPMGAHAPFPAPFPPMHGAFVMMHGVQA